MNYQFMYKESKSSRSWYIQLGRDWCFWQTRVI